jgi:hypothetical protein
MGVEDHGGDESEHGGVVGEDADHSGPSFDLAVESLGGIRGLDLLPVHDRERGELPAPDQAGDAAENGR